MAIMYSCLLVITILILIILQIISGSNLYEFEYNTNNIDDAGSSSNLYFYIHGSKLSNRLTANTLLSKGEKYTKQYDLGDVGELNYVVLYITGNDTWYPEYFKIRQEGREVCSKKMNMWIIPYYRYSINCAKQIFSVDKPAAMSSTLDRNQKAFTAFNGYFGRKYKRNYACPITNIENDPWIAVDLLVTVQLTEIGISTNDQPEYLLENLKIMAKSTGRYETCGVLFGAMLDVKYFIPCDAVARHVKVQEMGTNQIFCICQVEVFGSLIADDELTRAWIGKPVITSGESGKNGVDDNTDTGVYMHARSYNFFRVDLETDHHIDHIQIWFIEENNNELLGASIYAYTDVSPKYECAKFLETLGRVEITLQCIVTAQYVELLNTKNAPMKLREFQIYTVGEIYKYENAVQDSAMIFNNDGQNPYAFDQVYNVKALPALSPNYFRKKTEIKSLASVLILQWFTIHVTIISTVGIVLNYRSRL